MLQKNCRFVHQLLQEGADIAGLKNRGLIVAVAVGIGHIVDDPHHLENSSVELGHLIPGGGIIFLAVQGKQLVGYIHKAGQGRTEALGGQRHGAKLNDVIFLLQGKQIAAAYFGDGSIAGGLTDQKGEI